MIIKLQSPIFFARQKEEKTKTPTTHLAKVNADRLVMLLILMITIAGAIVFS